MELLDFLPPPPRACGWPWASRCRRRQSDRGIRDSYQRDPLTSFNLLRSNADTAVCKPYYDSTEENDGTNIVNMLIGAAATGVTVGGIGHDRLEWFLDGATCTNYVLKVTSVADDNKVSVEMTWMEVSGL